MPTLNPALSQLVLRPSLGSALRLSSAVDRQSDQMCVSASTLHSPRPTSGSGSRILRNLHPQPSYR